MAFSIAWMRSILRLPNSWFEVDIYREHVGGSWNEGNSSRRWSITYSPEFVKQVAKGKKLKPLDAILARAELPGVRVGDVDPLLAFLVATWRKAWMASGEWHWSSCGFQCKVL